MATVLAHIVNELRLLRAVQSGETLKKGDFAEIEDYVPGAQRKRKRTRRSGMVDVQTEEAILRARHR